MEFQEQVSAFEAITPLSPAMNDYQKHLAELVEEWQLSEEIRNAALFLPWIDQILDEASIQRRQLSPQVLDLLLEWHTLYQLTIVPPIGGHFQGDVRSLKLRRLMRLAYLNIPLVILTLLDHTARIKASLPEIEEREFWEDTKEIFIPLLSMLGLWELRREWIDQIFKRLNPADFNALNNRLSRIRENQQHYVEYVQSEIDQRFGGEKSFQCLLRPPSAGRILYRTQRGESLDELTDLVTVSIVAPNETDCYQALEFLHTLGLPIQGRFSDYLAAPNANGYRALHTTIIGNKKNPYGRHKVINFRVFTQKMNEMNLRGIIKGLYQEPEAYRDLPVWWKRKTSVKALELVRAYKIGDLPSAEETLIYLFTPHGEVKVLPKGSTALDFAYHLHTKIGHHCRGVQINGQEVTHSTELQNGDLVILNHDPLFQGPDPAWLHIARSERTRTKIKQGLRSIRQANHPGRQHIDHYLEALRKDSDFVVPEPQLEKYFMMVAEEMGLPNVNSLFDAIVPASQHDRSSLAPEKLISFILGAELATAVVDTNGKPIVSEKLSKPSFSQPVLRFCPNCKPAPGAPLVLHRKKKGKFEKLTLHRKAQTAAEPRREDEQLFGLHKADRKPLCLALINEDELDENVKWGNIDLGRVAANITILARDRSNLLGDILLPIYENDRVTLTHVQATSDSEGTADIHLVVEADRHEQITNLTAVLMSVSNVTKASYWPVTLSQSTHYKTRYTDHLEIPYTPGPVRDYQMLFGRDIEQNRIRQWLKGKNPQRLIIIRGQRRAGKTSLAMLTKKFLPPNVRTVYVDLLQTRRDPTTPTIYMTIIQEIYAALEKTISSDIPEAHYLPPDLKKLRERPREIFFAYLHRVQELIRPHRLLLILDEFNVLVSLCRDEAFFSELRAITVGDFPGISLMLITHINQQETVPSSHPVISVYEQGVPLDLATLDQEAAKALVVKPLATVLQYNDNVVTQLVNSTNGHPYLLNLLCREIVQNVIIDGRRYVRMEDLRIAVQALLRNGGTNFHFFIEHIDEGPARSLVAQIAQRQTKGRGWINLARTAESANVPYEEAQNIVHSLKAFDILSVKDSEAGSPLQVRLTIDYFCQWVCRNWK